MQQGTCCSAAPQRWRPLSVVRGLLAAFALGASLSIGACDAQTATPMEPPQENAPVIAAALAGELPDGKVVSTAGDMDNFGFGVGAVPCPPFNNSSGPIDQEFFDEPGIPRVHRGWAFKIDLTSDPDWRPQMQADSLYFDMRVISPIAGTFALHPDASGFTFPVGVCTPELFRRTVRHAGMVTSWVGDGRIWFGASQLHFAQGTTFDWVKVTVFTTEIPNTPPVADAAASDVYVECSHDGCGIAHLDARRSTDTDGTITDWTWRDDGGDVLARGASAAVELPLGTHHLTLTVTDDDGATASSTHTVEVVDTRAPQVTFAVDADALWPPNGRLVRVARGIRASDVCDAEASLSVTVSVEDASDRGRGRNGDEPDWSVIENADGSFDVFVRAERSGQGGGRTYTINATARDASGNESVASGTVVVAHDRTQP